MAAPWSRDAWRQPGCADTCARRTVILPGLVGRQTLELHDPEAHEWYGRALAGDQGAVPILESGPLRLDRRTQQLWIDDAETWLTPSEWSVLLAIVDGNGRPVSCSDLAVRLWGRAPTRRSGHCVRVILTRLRARLGAAAGLIETTAGVGYRFLFIEPGAHPPPPRVHWATPRVPRHRLEDA